MARRTSRSEAAIDAKLDTLPKESRRYAMLLAARTFKASWVALGEELVAVKSAQSFVQWGYKTFEAYCRDELHIRAETALKLTRSYAYLKDHVPEALRQEHATRPPPALDVVDLLSQAHARTKVSPEALKSIHASLTAGDAAVSRHGLLKRLREEDPDAFRTKAQGEAPKVALGGQDLRKALLLAERLVSLLEHADAALSDASKEALRRVHKELERAFRGAQGQPSMKASAQASPDLVHAQKMH